MSLFQPKSSKYISSIILRTLPTLSLNFCRIFIVLDSSCVVFLLKFQISFLSRNLMDLN